MFVFREKNNSTIAHHFTSPYPETLPNNFNQSRGSKVSKPKFIMDCRKLFVRIMATKTGKEVISTFRDFEIFFI